MLTLVDSRNTNVIYGSNRTQKPCRDTCTSKAGKAEFVHRLRYGLNDAEFKSRKGQKISRFQNIKNDSVPAHQNIKYDSVRAQSHIQCLQVSFLGENQAGRAVHHSPPSSAGVKEE